LKSICVFCGSGHGARPEYSETARKLGELFVKKNIGLVYGGGSIGLMGDIASVMQQNGGHITGVITKQLVEWEVAYKELEDLRVVDTMHERKALMAELADAFIVLPGGFGTLDEIFEILTWYQLGLHSKQYGFLNVNRFYTPLISFLEHVVDQKFIKPENFTNIKLEEEPEALLEMMGF